MNTALMILLAIASIILIVSVLLQSSKSDGLSGAIAGGAEQLFGKKKSRGLDALLEKVTVVAAVCSIAISIVLVAISK